MFYLNKFKIVFLLLQEKLLPILRRCEPCTRGNASERADETDCQTA